MRNSGKLTRGRRGEEIGSNGRDDSSPPSAGAGSGPRTTGRTPTRYRVAVRCSREARGRVKVQAVRRLVTRLADALVPADDRGRVISVYFCGDPEMAALNLTFRSKAGPTDVLTFRCDDDRPEGSVPHFVPLGDIVVSVDTAERQALRAGASLGEEVARLLVHGLHHLVGFEHEGVPGAVAARMRRSERSFRAAVTDDEAGSLVSAAGSRG